MTEILDFSKICRVCCGEGKMMSLFKVHVSKKLMACSSIQVWPNDGLPGQICTKCVAKLHITFQFRKLCEKSNIRLKNYVENQQAQKKENVNTQQDMQQNTDSGINYNYSEGQQAVVNHNFDPQPGIQTFHHSQPISYHNVITNHGAYTIQTLQPVHFQTYSLPAQLPESHQILTIGQATTNGSMTQPNNNEDKIKVPKIEKEDGNVQHNCYICGKEFSSANKLSRHVKIHSGDMSYRCTICQKGFTHSGNFKVHMRMHTDERPYKCRICEKACRQQQDLEKHMRTHTGEKPHGCKECGKAFSTSSNLIAHSRIHSGEKPYVCSVCQKAFCQSNELTKHTRTHTGEKTHICDICNKGFNGSSTLIVHMRSHTGERPYACKICEKSFTQSSCLQIHLKRHQNNKTNDEQPLDGSLNLNAPA